MNFRAVLLSIIILVLFLPLLFLEEFSDGFVSSAKTEDSITELLAISNDSIIIGTESGDIFHWKGINNKMDVIMRIGNPITGIVETGKENYIFVSTRNGSLYSINIIRLEISKILQFNDTILESLSFNPQKLNLALGTNDGRVFIYDGTNISRIFNTDREDIIVSDLDWNKHNELAIGLKNAHKVILWRNNSQEEILAITESKIVDVTWNSDSTGLGIGTEGGEVLYIKAGSNETLMIGSHYGQNIQGFSLANHPSNPLLFCSGGADRVLRVWNVETRAEMVVFSIDSVVGHSSWVNNVLWLENGNIISSDYYGKVIIWDYSSKKSIPEIPSLVPPIMSLILVNCLLVLISRLDNSNSQRGSEF
ncbi:MAG: WD40 repeat domain-containing protein [Candidatus Thorarchaeota archaeon]